MAHPLTQHASSALPFGQAARPSPLAFGFGGSSLGTGSAGFGSPAPSVPGSPACRFGGTTFGQSFVAPSSPSQPRPFGSARPSLANTAAARSSSFLVAPTPQRSASSSLKRSRRSISPTPSSSPSPAPSLNLSPKRGSASVRRSEDISVDDLDIAEGSSAPARRLKRLRKTTEIAEPAAKAEEYDVGLLLTSLPASSHLQILQALLKDDPSLKAKINALMPTPDLQDCLRTLELTADSVRRSMPSAGALADPKLQARIQQYCQQAQTYLQFFAHPPASPPPPPSSMFALLQNVTEGICVMLSTLQTPANRAILESVQQDISNVAQTIIARWRSWVSEIDETVNARGEMFPHSFLVPWFEGLDRLANHSNSQGVAGTSGQTAPLLAAPFYEALSSVRATMVDRLGWTIGRAPGSY